MTRIALLLAACVGCSSSAFDVAEATDTGTDSAATGGADTMTADAPSRDSALADTRDTAICPRPASTNAGPSVTALTCDQTLARYNTAIGEAKACTCDADCSVVIPTDWCGCKTNASPANDAYLTIGKLREHFESMGCAEPGCGIVPCAPPPVPKCLPQADGALACN